MEQKRKGEGGKIGPGVKADHAGKGRKAPQCFQGRDGRGKTSARKGHSKVPKEWVESPGTAGRGKTNLSALISPRRVKEGEKSPDT